LCSDRKLADGGAGVLRGGSLKDGGGNAGSSAGRGVSRLHLQWLGLHAFMVVLRRKHARYGALFSLSAERAELREAEDSCEGQRQAE
jgi:hypothetical protein